MLFADSSCGVFALLVGVDSVFSALTDSFFKKFSVLSLSAIDLATEGTVVFYGARSFIPGLSVDP